MDIKARQNRSCIQKFITKNTPETGTVVNHGEYESFKSGLSGLALKRGYFDAEMEKASSALRFPVMRPTGIFVFNRANDTVSESELPETPRQR